MASDEIMQLQAALRVLRQEVENMACFVGQLAERVKALELSQIAEKVEPEAYKKGLDAGLKEDDGRL